MRTEPSTAPAARRAPSMSQAQINVMCLVVIGAAAVVAFVLAEPWLRAVDRLAGADPVWFSLGVIGWCWLLGPLTAWAIHATWRFGQVGSWSWLLVAAVAGPLLRYSPSRRGSARETNADVVAILGHASPDGVLPLATILVLVLGVGLGWWLWGVSRASVPSRADWWAPVVAWTVVWAVVAAIAASGVG